MVDFVISECSASDVLGKYNAQTLLNHIKLDDVIKYWGIESLITAIGIEEVKEHYNLYERDEIKEIHYEEFNDKMDKLLNDKS
jgi:hypothetical protein